MSTDRPTVTPLAFVLLLLAGCAAAPALTEPTPATAPSSSRLPSPAKPASESPTSTGASPSPGLPSSSAPSATPGRFQGPGEDPILVGTPVDPAVLRGKIVFDDFEDVFTMNADASSLARVTQRSGAEFDGAWSPDGEWIIFNSDRDGILSGYLVHPDGSGLERIGVDTWFEYPSFSPDGARVVFSGHAGSDYDIYVADLATGATTRLTDADGADGWPVWSPDGKSIAFASERDDCTRVPDTQDCWRTGEPGEHHDIWLMDADGSDQRRVTPEFGQFVAWAPDGEHLLISGYTLFVIRLDGSGRREIRPEGLQYAPGGILTGSPSRCLEGRTAAAVVRLAGKPR